MTRSDTPELSLVVPCFDDEACLLVTVDSVLEWLDRRVISAELILVDDGSSDGTPQIIEGRAAEDDRIVPVLTHPNRGKGAAVTTGVRAARGRVVIFFDSDLAYPLDTIDIALDHLSDGADLAIGARELSRADARRGYAWPRRLASRVFNQLVRGALDLPVRDTQCGFKAFRGPVARALFEAITIPGFGFDVELLFLARRWGLRIDLIPVTMTHGAHSSLWVLRHAPRMAGDIARVGWQSLRGRYPNRRRGL